MSKEDHTLEGTLKPGDHCWAIHRRSRRLLVVMKTHTDYYEVCGAWEGGIHAYEITPLTLIKKPPGYEDVPLYYGPEGDVDE